MSKNFTPEKSSLLQALHLIQKTQGFVSETDMLLLSKYLKVAKSEIFGAITSYPEIKTQIENDLNKHHEGKALFDGFLLHGHHLLDGLHVY